MQASFAKSLRLSETDRQSICDAFRKTFGPQSHLWLFGSRTQLDKKGGDIDLYIETSQLTAKEVVEIKQKFMLALIKSLGDQKIDIVIKFDDFDLPIYEVAKATGVKLV